MTGCNEAFIINEEQRNKILADCKNEEERTRTAKIIRPILKGKDIRKNSYEWPNSYVINVHNGYKTDDGKTLSRIDIYDYPSLKKWFDTGDWNDKPEKGTNIQRLEKRTDHGDTPYNLRDCAYMDDFNKQKILYSEIVRSPKFYLDNKNFVPEATTFILSGEHLESLVQYLNSPLIAWIFKTFYAGGGLGSDGYRYKKQFLINLPIPRVFNGSFSDERISNLYHFSDEEMYFISSSVSL